MRVRHPDVYRGLNLGPAQWALRGRAGRERKYQAGANLGLDDDPMIGMKTQFNLHKGMRSCKAHQVIRSPDALAAFVTQPHTADTVL